MTRDDDFLLRHTKMPTIPATLAYSDGSGRIAIEDASDNELALLAHFWMRDLIAKARGRRFKKTGSHEHPKDAGKVHPLDTKMVPR